MNNPRTKTTDPIHSLLKIIKNFSSKEYQNKAWIEGNGVDFDENVCLFFDLGDPIINDFDSFSITKLQLRTLKKFREELEAFSDEHIWPGDFIDSPDWARIMNLAKEVLKAFNVKS